MSKISFIIPAYNEEAYLPLTLQSIHEAARSAGLSYEIIVVDDASTDRTGEVTRQHGGLVHRVELRHIAAVRNAGAQRATGDVLVFVDADTVVPPETLRAALEALEQGAIGGGSAVRFDGQVPWYYQLFLHVIVFAFRQIRWAAGCFIFCRREAFDAAGGFDEAYYASEEIWMSKALKRQGRFVVLRQQVISSGRKARLYSLREMLPILCKILVKGPNGTKQRKGLEFWYESRREPAMSGPPPDLPEPPKPTESPEPSGLPDASPEMEEGSIPF